MAKSKNEIIIHEDHAEIKLKGRHGGSVKIDLCDVERMSQHCWANKENRTAQTRIDNRLVPMPRLILEAKEGDKVITNRVAPFDFRRHNLRLIKAVK